ncbi:MAG TPA: hypothetical protein V6C69_14305 [Trichormus sp.]|jgi:hypothetical protein
MKARSKRGSGITESVVAAIVLIPLALCLIDLMALVVCNSMNDTLVKNMARAAANQTESGAGFAAAENARQSFKPSPLVGSIDLEAFEWPPDGTQDPAVTVKTRMVVHMPVPFPYFGDSVQFVAQDVEPIVAQTATP